MGSSTAVYQASESFGWPLEAGPWDLECGVHADLDVIASDCLNYCIDYIPTYIYLIDRHGE